ncbi:hypothetical protein RIR_jg3948.t1 [Rhizophagus irregularis DAOM 181602=DAOM 197198]|nr:hypothetical protein RIR_jg3948.t1 [Rhizophagus irregularis DAOM 181602=DAOM 197198]
MKYKFSQIFEHNRNRNSNRVKVWTNLKRFTLLCEIMSENVACRFAVYLFLKLKKGFILPTDNYFTDKHFADS